MSGRKRHAVVDMLSSLGALGIAPADVQHRDGVQLAWKAFRRVVPFDPIL